jgi:hypothetical protein
MRYTKIALLLFGLGLASGFVIVVGELSKWERVASALMALGLVALPIGLFADGHGMKLIAWIARRFTRGKPRKHRAKSRTAVKRRKPAVRQRPAVRAPRPGRR